MVLPEEGTQSCGDTARTVMFYGDVLGNAGGT
jgi:hypothetical protein